MGVSVLLAKRVFGQKNGSLCHKIYLEREKELLSSIHRSVYVVSIGNTVCSATKREHTVYTLPRIAFSYGVRASKSTENNATHSVSWQKRDRKKVVYEKTHRLLIPSGFPKGFWLMTMFTRQHGIRKNRQLSKTSERRKESVLKEEGSFAGRTLVERLKPRPPGGAVRRLACAAAEVKSEGSALRARVTQKKKSVDVVSLQSISRCPIASKKICFGV